MTLTTCILRPSGPLHLGEREGVRAGSGGFIHSDTLFSALCHGLLLLEGRNGLEEFLAAEQDGQPAVVISSAFPFWQGRCCFPVPANQLPADKRRKRLRFVFQGEFERLLTGQPLGENPDDYSLPAGAVVTRDVPRVTVARGGGQAETGGLYHVGQTVCSADTAFFFLVRFGSDAWRRRLEAALQITCQEGIGGCRSIGLGGFHPPEFTQTELAVPEAAEAGLLLSLYYPREGESEGLSEGWYNLITRRGYVFSPETRSLRRRPVTMFAEGSVLPRAQRIGRLIDVTPDPPLMTHRVWRNGLAFTVPCRLQVTPPGGNDD